MFRKKLHTKGFTLIELLVVIAIISVLATLLMANFVGVRQRARDAQRKSDLRQIQAALELYRSDNGDYPESLYSTNCPTSAAFTSIEGTSYMTKVPCDPLTKNNYVYQNDAPSGIYTIYACLENINDLDKDAADGAAGDLCGTAVVSMTLRTP